MSKSRGRCFTIKHSGISHTLKSDVLVVPVVPDKPQISSKAVALWDTGATSTCITPKLANELSLGVVSKTLISTPSGTRECNQYFINVVLTNNVIIENVLAIEAIPSNCDVLIGMDIITTGDFAVTHFNGETAFSFRVPSIQHIDFTKHSYLQPTANEPKQNRNDKCACGSGKKYKDCCDRSSL